MGLQKSSESASMIYITLAALVFENSIPAYLFLSDMHLLLVDEDENTAAQLIPC